MFGLEPLQGAYGRDYTSLKSLQADFDAGKDFVCSSGAYVNKEDLQNENLKQVRVRYCKLTKTGFIKV
jgi:hypothetical protein